MKITLTNDFPFDLSFYVLLYYKNRKKRIHIDIPGGKSHVIDYLEDVFRMELTKKYLWDDKNKFTKFFMLVFSLDLMWGNLMETNNMPISIDFKYDVSPGIECVIKTSDIVKISLHNLKLWKKALKMQNILLISLIVLMCGFICSFIPSPFIYFAIALCIIMIVYLIIRGQKHQSRIIKILENNVL